MDTPYTRLSPTRLSLSMSYSSGSLALAEDLNQVMADVLQGKQRIVSYPQTSQYGPGGIGAAACGFAALNCARIAFLLEDRLMQQADGKKDYSIPLLRSVLSYETTEEIVSICSSWKSSRHLEVEDLLEIPIFKNTFNLARTKYGQSNYRGFQGLIMDTLSLGRNSVVAAVVTRSPEILVCLKIPTHSAIDNFFVVFDSHPRQNHPLGSGMIVCSSIDATAAYLEETLGVGAAISNDLGNYQAMVLGQFSGHILVAKSPEDGMSVDALMMKASVDLLDLKGELDTAKQNESNLWSRNQELQARVYLLEHQLQMARSQASSGKKKNKGHNQNYHPTSYSIDVELSREIMEHHKIHPSSNQARAPNTSNQKEFPHLKGKGTAHSGSQIDKSQSHSKPHSANAIAGPSSSSSNGYHLPPGPDLYSERLALQLQQEFDQENEAIIQSAHSQMRHTPSDEWTLQSKRQKSQKSSYSDALNRPSGSGQSGSGSSKKKKDLPQQWLPRSKQAVPAGSDTVAISQNGGQSSKQQYPPNHDDLLADPSELAAIRLQLQFDQEEKSIALDTVALQKQFPVFECPLCMDSALQEEMIRLSDCDHAYCRSCMQQYIEVALKERRYPIPCPVCAIEKTRQPSAIDNSTFEIVGLKDKDLAIFQEMQLNAYSVPLSCRMCNKTMFVDRHEFLSAGNITCPLPECNHVWCKDCQQTIEIGGPPHSCDGSTELDALLKAKGWHRCPGCSIPIQRSTGCNHMKCSIAGCNTHFCYLCGELIVKTIVSSEVTTALDNHYTKCRMFDYSGV